MPDGRPRRQRRPEAAVGLFLHIPFPPFETFTVLPWRRQLLQGMLGSDLVGFHTYDYMSHFLECVTRLEGHDNAFGRIETAEHSTQADVFPMGIDFERFAAASHASATRRQIARIKKGAGDRRIILSMNRLDYTKGIPEVRTRRSGRAAPGRSHSRPGGPPGPNISLA